MLVVAGQRRKADAALDGVLVRRPATEDWLSTLPAAPYDQEVTVSLTDAAAAIRHSAELAARGYVPVGAAGCVRGGVVTADFLVPRALATGSFDWLVSLLGPDGKVYEPGLGPVRLLLKPVLDAHRSGRARVQ